jgi:hypothetical protein
VDKASDLPILLPTRFELVINVQTGTLRTIGEACDYMTSMGKKRELQPRWQRVCKLILAKEDVLTVSRALELALFMDAKLDVSKI